MATTTIIKPLDYASAIQFGLASDANPDPVGGEGVEYGRFEDLARKLAQVPKSELDEQRRTA